MPGVHGTLVWPEEASVFEQVAHQQQQPVVAVTTHAGADLLVATLGVHGIDAATAMPSVYPSLDWVEGIIVTVAEDDALDARQLLRELGHEPLAGS